MYVSGIINDTNSAVGMGSTVPIPKRQEIIRGLFDSFYKDGNEVCFNTNRGWAASTSLLADLYPGFKMIICVREIPWILDSFEQLNAKNPYTVKPLYHHQQLSTVYERCAMLMGNITNYAGYVAGPLANVKQSLFCNEKSQLLYLEYDTLVKQPLLTMQQIYKFLEEPWFGHDFNNVEDSYDEFDEQAKIAGLHTVRKKVEFRPRNSILPGDIWNQNDPLSFWKKDFEQIRSGLNWIGSPVPVQPTSMSVPRLNKQL